jgi:hypothetical protein
MLRVRRILAVTAGLAVAGALTGAVCGLLALTPLVVSSWLRLPNSRFAMFSDLALWAATAGAALGAVCGPLLAWSLLRHLPLWRVIAWAAVGTVLGSLGGWAASGNPFVPGLFAVFGGALLGMATAGVGLRRRAARLARARHLEAAT